ncbi:MAG: hypothetical protein N0C84_07825 [Candidatus Thiodiazotropha taylori]|uniref:Uncharacterized protein n=1 Tax=Candidatus Thiodiazotropha taylori TaxID=2792791 RepID=A0A9E4N3Y6_9GAMM|nr:hypothetical protein [Candidatus Thiodiazotropha taylori]MCW4256360.1 hypothetical protein [Candidatus Thiodiazotropha taylori]
MKLDGPESPHCVYNEQVALKLAQTLHIPTANGVLVTVGDGPAYASLEIALPGIPLPDLHRGLYSKAANAYPDAAAATFVFDLWIGNTDRHNNIKASLVTPNMPLYLAFDHSHALLNIESSAMKSIQTLRDANSIIITNHPFVGLTDMQLVDKWVGRIASTPPEFIDECCLIGRPFRNVSVRIQTCLANALKFRASQLTKIITMWRNFPIAT